MGTSTNGLPTRQDTIMECISCGTSESLNRAVINQLSREEYGVYCEDCEKKEFGSLLDGVSWHQPHGCAFCDGTGKYKLPKVDCIIEYSDGTIDFELTSVEDSVALCANHTESLFAKPINLSNPRSSGKESAIKIEM